MAPRRSLAWMAGRRVPEDAARPDVCAVSPSRMRTAVVLPAPLGPSTASSSPALDGEVDTAQRGHRPVVLGDVL